MKSNIGVIGLGVMGRSLALNMLDRAHKVSVYNRPTDGEEGLLGSFLNDANDQAQGFDQIEPFLDSLESPRAVFLMIKAGEAIDQVIKTLKPHLSKGDVIIDGGNSHFGDTIRRFSELKTEGIHFVGCGVSGGESGARFGPSIMPGGSKEGYGLIKSTLTSIAAKDEKGNPCCGYIGEGGAGHFVKMIHNGIEYAEMQLIAEIYFLFSQSMTNERIAAVFGKWNDGDLGSYLLEITIDILRKKEGDQYLVDIILDQAGNKGTGSWSSQTALQLGLPTTMMTDAVFARYVSAKKNQRTIMSRVLKRKDSEYMLSVDLLEDAYRFGRIINHQQGFELIMEASSQFEWNVNLSEVARIWTNGCIIRSKFMEECADHLLQYESIFGSEKQIKELKSIESSCEKTISQAMKLGLPTPVLSSAIQYWLGMCTENLPANVIQAQRDYFGAHTYQRKDDPSRKYHHTDWSK